MRDHLALLLRMGNSKSVLRMALSQDRAPCPLATAHNPHIYESIPNYLERALHFSGALAGLVAEQPELRIAHFRDPWSGVALLDRAEVPYKTVYEINGLPRRDLSRKPRAAASLPEASRLQKALHRRRSAAKPAGLLSVARRGGDEC